MHKSFNFFLDYHIAMVKDPLLATVLHSTFKTKPILSVKRDALQQELIAVANNMSTENEAKSDCNKTSGDFFFHYLNDDKESFTPNTHNHTLIKVLQYLENFNSSLDSLYLFPIIKKVSTKFNTALTLPVFVERLLLIILQGRKGRSTDKKFEKLTLLKAKLRDLSSGPLREQSGPGTNIHSGPILTRIW